MPMQSLLIMAGFLTVWAGEARAAAASPSNETVSKDITELLSRWDKPDSPGVAVAVVKDGSVIFKGAFGQANLEYGVSITALAVTGGDRVRNVRFVKQNGPPPAKGL